MTKSDIMKAAELAKDFMNTKEGLYEFHGFATALIAAAELLKQVEWQPIESAPKDGAEILICEADKYIHIGMWHDDGVYKYWMSDGGHEIDCPSAWQPLPQPPVIIDKEGV